MRNTKRTFGLGTTFILITITLFLISLGVGVQIQTSNASFSEQADNTNPIISVETAPPIPDNPIADLISISAADSDGYATVSGKAGSVAANAYVGIVNLNTRSVITTTADAQGAFLTAPIFAPPGAWLQVKHDLDGERVQALWRQAKDKKFDATIGQYNGAPGTILRAGELPGRQENIQEFAIVGAFFTETDSDWAGWGITGTLELPPGTDTSSFNVQAGDVITITANLRVTSPSYSCSPPIPYNISSDINFQQLFNPEGRAMPWGTWFSSHLFTPTGLPIEHEAGAIGRGVSSNNTFTNLMCSGDHSFRGTMTAVFEIPLGTPDGVYIPEIFLRGDFPSTDLPFSPVWFHSPDSDTLPPLTVGSPAQPRLPLTVLSDYPVNGHRGVGALEDVRQYSMPTRTLFPPHRVVIPRLAARSGEPITYSLEPGSNWISATDRRLPNRPHLPILFPSGELLIEVIKPNGYTLLGPVPIQQSSMRTPTTRGGDELQEGTGHVGDILHFDTLDPAFDYEFDQYGDHTLFVNGHVQDIYGNSYSLKSTFEFTVAQVLDLDPGQLPTTPYVQGDYFSPGMHIFPPVPAWVSIAVTHLPDSNPENSLTHIFEGQANRYGYFHPPLGDTFQFTEPGEFRVDIMAEYMAPDNNLWVGTMTWGNVVENSNPLLIAHGRRGMDYHGDLDDTAPIWFTNEQLLEKDLLGIENYYPYFSGDIHWGNEDPTGGDAGDSIHSIITIEDTTGEKKFYNILRENIDRSRSCFRWPPDNCDAAGLEDRISINEAPLFITTYSGVDPVAAPEQIDLFSYWYGSSERPDVHVREIISEDGMGTAYWRFNDTYGLQLGEPADGDQPGDLKWEFGGAVLRTITDTFPINEYAIYSSLWVLLPHGCDEFGCARVTAPFRNPGSVSIDGGPILTLLDKEINVLFLPKGVRPGDILELGDTISFSGHVGPPLDSRVEVTITSPSGKTHSAVWHANKIGWLYNPDFDFPAEESGRWTVEVFVEHDRNLAYAPAPTKNNTGTVLGTQGQYEFYVVAPDSPEFWIESPEPGFLPWPRDHIEPIPIVGRVPLGTSRVYYTIHDKGIVMGQGALTPNPAGEFTFVYDPEALHQDFPMLSLTSHEGRWRGLADEVTIHFFADSDSQPRAASVVLIGEQVFLRRDFIPPRSLIYLPLTKKE